MKGSKLKKLITRERRGYLFAAICSAIAALLLFYKLLLNDLYLKILDFPLIALVLSLLIIGNAIHGFFAFRGHQALNTESALLEVVKIKITFYKSLLINFLMPYAMLIILFLSMKEFRVAIVASMLFFMMISGCYYFDLRPTLNLKNEKFD